MPLGPIEQRLGPMIDREAIERENKMLGVRLKFASLRQTAIVEDAVLDPTRRTRRSKTLRGLTPYEAICKAGLNN